MWHHRLSDYRKWLLAVALTVLLYSPQAPGAEPGVRRALLIGINDYQALPVLSGAINDVEAMRDLLVDRYAFKPDNVTVLTDSQASRNGILRAMEALVSRTGPDDIVYIHYSGHGSRVEDLSGDEDDGADETICPRDARTAGVPDITDDEIDRIISRFRTPSVFVVMDSCHSGTVLRSAGSGIRPRFVPPDDRIHLYQRQQNDIRTRAVVNLPASEGYLLITGAAAHESALDGPFDNGRYHGLLTYSLTRTLNSLPRNASPLQIMDGIKQQIAAMDSELEGHPVPEPQLEAPAERLSAPFLAMIDDSTDAVSSYGRQRADIVLRNMNASIRARLERDLPGLVPGLSLSGGSDGPADFVVDCNSSTPASSWSCEVLAHEGDDRPFGIKASPENMAVQLAGAIRKLQVMHAMEMLGERDSNLRIDIRLAAAEQTAVRYRGINISRLDAPARVQFYRPGAIRTPNNSLQIEVRSSHDCYLSIAYLDSGGGFQVIFPDAGKADDFSPGGLIQGGMTTLIPDSLSTDNLAGFHWDFGPPAGEDTVYAFCMTGQEQASHLRERIRNLGQLSGVAVNDALQDITRELTAAKPGTVTRGIRTAMSSKDEADSQPGGWGVAHLRLQVTE